MMDFYGGCLFCEKAVDCQIAGEPAADCPVEALNKAWKDFKTELKDDIAFVRIYKAANWILDRLSSFIESFHKIS